MRRQKKNIFTEFRECNGSFSKDNIEYILTSMHTSVSISIKFLKCKSPKNVVNRDDTHVRLNYVLRLFRAN